MPHRRAALELIDRRFPVLPATARVGAQEVARDERGYVVTANNRPTTDPMSELLSDGGWAKLAKLMGRDDLIADARFVDAALELPAAYASPEQLVAEREALRTLYAVLDLMKPQHREVLVLVDMEQLTVVETARALGVNTSSCYKRLSAARGQFEREVQRHQANTRWRRR